jgi:hypothetical protein
LWLYAAIPLIICAITALVSLIVLFSVALRPQAEALYQYMPQWFVNRSVHILTMQAWMVDGSFISFHGKLLTVTIVAESFLGYFQEKIFVKTLELRVINSFPPFL